MLTKIESACANTIINYFLNYGSFITHMKIQKLYYFFVGRYLAKTNIYMAEHNFEAWTHGPVLPSLYNSLAHYYDKKIENLIILENESQPYIYKTGDIFNEIIRIVNDLGNYTAFQLSDKSHAIGGPWYQTVTKYKCYKKEINRELIRDYFKNNEII